MFYYNNNIEHKMGRQKNEQAAAFLFTLMPFIKKSLQV